MSTNVGEIDLSLILNSDKFNSQLKNQDFSISSMYEMIEVLMGKEALKEIKDMKLTIDGLRSVIIAISAIVSEVEFEEMEKRFQ